MAPNATEPISIALDTGDMVYQLMITLSLYFLAVAILAQKTTTLSNRRRIKLHAIRY
jgi:hypothetical protein